MELTRIELTDYRNYRQQALELKSGINVLAGDNAQGKTNLLEAVRLCSIGRSHRTARDRELVREGAPQARVAIEWRRRDGSHELSALIPACAPKQMRADGKALRRSGELMGLIATVLFAPEDLALVKAGPGERRRFMDMELSQLRPVYYYALQRYNRALRQRNSLLRELDGQSALRATLDGWDDVLAREGAQIVAQRARFVELLGECARHRHAQISGGERLDCTYASAVDPGDPERSMRRGLEEARARDMRALTSTFGPHRDDLALTIDGREARAFGSQGQQRTVSLSLKLSQLSVMRDECGEWPVLLLDDVMSELDPGRRRTLIGCMEGVQALVTCTDMGDLAGARVEQALRVSGGSLQKCQ